MRFFSVWLFLLLAAPFAWAQDDDPCGCGCGDDDEIEIIVDGGANDGGKIDLVVDPFGRSRMESATNRPAAFVVGEYEPPALSEKARKEVQELLAQRGENMGETGPLYRLADFYLQHGWYPDAEAALQNAARIDPESTRPWETMLRLYRIKPKTESREELLRRLMAAGVPINFADLNNEQRKDWLMNDQRQHRIVRALEEIIKRRPDDISRRRELVDVLRFDGSDIQLVPHARAILQRAPQDIQTRYELAEAMRRIAEAKARAEYYRKKNAENPQGGTEGEGDLYRDDVVPIDPNYDESIQLLEENLAKAPSHTPSALRLVRMLARRDGAKAEERIVRLERTAVFHLFIRSEIAAVALRDDTFRMVRDLIGPAVAGKLWDEQMVPDWYRDRGNNNFFNQPADVRPRRWVFIYFPHAQKLRRLEVIKRLGRRADRSSAAILLSYLWHLDGPGVFDASTVDGELPESIELEDAAIASVGRLGAAALPVVRSYFDLVEKHSAGVQPDSPRTRWEVRNASRIHYDRQRRAVKLLAQLRDRGAVGPLLRALDWDRHPEAGLLVSRALEAVGDDRAVGGLVDAAMDTGRPMPRRLEAAEALAAFRDPRSISAMTSLRKVAEFEFVAAYALFRLAGDEKGLERLSRAVAGEAAPERIFGMLEKCRDDRVATMLTKHLTTLDSERAGMAVDHLKRRYWPATKPAVRAHLLARLDGTSVPDYVIELVPTFPEPAVAEKLLAQLEKCAEKDWPKFARALASTGDDRAVRFFSRIRVLGKKRGRRRLARELHEAASRRQSELKNAKR